MGVVVIVAYRPKPGREADLLALVRSHVPALRRLDLVTNRPAQAMRARDGSILELFEWADGALDVAHGHPEVLSLWERFAAVCDYVPLRDLGETGDLFAQFEPLAP